MRPLARYAALVVGSAAYWAGALFLVLFMSWVVGGDCGLEQTDAGLEACAQEKRWAVAGTLAVVATGYFFVVRTVLRSRR